MSLQALEHLELNNLTDAFFVAAADNKSASSAVFALPSALKTLALESCASAESQIPFDFGTASVGLQRLTITGVKWLDLDDHVSTSRANVKIALSTVVESFSRTCGMSADEVHEVYTSKLSQVKSKSKSYLTWREACEFNAFIFERFARLTRIPAGVFTLARLTHLDLSYQAIRDIPDEIGALSSLVSLTCNNCIRLETISAKLAHLTGIGEVLVKNCVSMKTPPLEICQRGSHAILAYLKRLSSGSVICRRTKLMLVGLGEAGKTSLLNALISFSPTSGNDRPLITDGIDIKEWSVDTSQIANSKQESSAEPLVYSMWDFAGQSVYYNSHQFFLSSRAVYLLVW